MLKKKDDYDNENVYIGSTSDFTRRKYGHKTSCNNPKSREHNLKKYQYIRENGGWDEWIMIVIENYPCNDKLELFKREDEIMCEMKSKLNDKRANRNKKKYYEDNKEHIAEYHKEWCEVNKEQRAEKAKEYQEVNKEKLTEYHKEYREANKEKIKEWREDNKEHISKYNKKYRELNKEKIQCDICGCEIGRDSLARHRKTKKCQGFINKIIIKK